MPTTSTSDGVDGQGEHAQVAAGQRRAAARARRRRRGRRRRARPRRPGSQPRPGRPAAARCGTGASGPPPRSAGGPARPVRPSAISPGSSASGAAASSPACARPAARRPRRTARARRREVKNPTLMRRASTSGTVRAIAKARGAQLVERRRGGPARDPERDERRHVVARGEDLDAVDRGQPVGRAGGPSPRRARRPSRARRTCDSQPIERAIPTIDGPVEVRRTRTAARPASTTAVPAESTRLEAEVPAEGRAAADRAPRAPPRGRPCPPDRAATSGPAIA